MLLAGVVAVFVARPLLPSELPTTVAGDGLPFVMITLLLAACWLAANVNVPGDRRLGTVDLSWCALLGWQAASAWLATRSGFARAAVNTFWEWLGLGCGFLLLRSVLTGDRERRAIIVVFIALAVLLSLDGIQQYYVELPAMREAYRSHPEKALQEIGIDAPPGSAARMLFEQRLNSTEPAATFALANSLAGFLTPWLLTAIGLATFAPIFTGPSPWRYRLTAAAAALPMALCLMLTKSRAGYLAVASGAMVIVCLSRRTWRQTFLLAGLLAVLAAIFAFTGYASGSLDRQVLTQAAQSLSYRWHYWQGALGIVREHPWFGCGPGNFQDEYTRFKLPQASEVVADPHNFVFEIWASFGTPALLAFIGVLVAAICGPRSAATVSATSERADDGERAVLFGAVAGLVLAFCAGLISTVNPPLPVLLAGIVIVPLIWLAFSGWISTGEMPRFLPSAAAAALLVNLLVAGGIGFAGVAGSLWLLLAVSSTSGHGPAIRLPGRAPAILALGIAILFAACYITAYRPVLTCRGLLAEAERPTPTARERLVQGAEADPLADEPWRRLAAGDFAAWEEQPTAELADRWRHDQEELLARRPHSSAAWLEAGERFLAAARLSNDERAKHDYAARAAEHLRRATELYPNFALAHANLALALAAAGQPGTDGEATAALRLHEATPHADLKLPPDLVKTMQKLARTEP